MSLFHPPAWFPPQLAFLWPLIWVQVLMLRAQIRAAYGPGVKYHWCIGANGRVYLYSIDWIPGQKPAVLHTPKDRLAAACDGRAFVPAYAAWCAMPQDAGDAPCVRPVALSSTATLPLPET